MLSVYIALGENALFEWPKAFYIGYEHFKLFLVMV